MTEVYKTIPVKPAPGYVRGIISTPDGGYLYLTNHMVNGYISVIERSSNTVIKEIFTGTKPYGISITPDGKYVYTGCYEGTGGIKIIDTSINEITKTLQVYSTYDICMLPGGDYAYATNHMQSEVVKIDLSAQTIAKRISTVGGGATMAVCTLDGRYLYVSCPNLAAIKVLDTNTDKFIKTIDVGATGYWNYIDKSRDDKYIYIYMRSRVHKL